MHRKLIVSPALLPAGGPIIYPLVSPPTSGIWPGIRYAVRPRYAAPWLLDGDQVVVGYVKGDYVVAVTSSGFASDSRILCRTAGIRGVQGC
jgi:hypothetical protein